MPENLDKGLQVILVYLRYQRIPREKWEKLVRSRLPEVADNTIRSVWRRIRDSEDMFADSKRSVSKSEAEDFVRRQNLDVNELEGLRLFFNAEEEREIQTVREL
jgi:hypothetical protein